MANVRCKGRLKQKFAGSSDVLEYVSPKVTFPCEAILNDPEALAAMSGEVKTYFLDEEEENWI